MRVLLAGASGLVGTQVLRQLLEDPRCSRVVAPTRRPLAQVHPRLLNPVRDFSELPLEADWWQVDAAICALGSTMRQAGSREVFRQIDHGYPLLIAQTVKRHGCKVFALNSAAGANPRSPVFYSRIKGELEYNLRALGFDALTLVRPGLIGGERAERRPGEHIAGRVLGVLGPVLPRAWRINPADHIAQALVEAVLAPQPGERVIGPAQLA